MSIEEDSAAPGSILFSLLGGQLVKCSLLVKYWLYANAILACLKGHMQSNSFSKDHMKSNSFSKLLTYSADHPVSVLILTLVQFQLALLCALKATAVFLCRWENATLHLCSIDVSIYVDGVIICIHWLPMEAIYCFLEQQYAAEWQ